MLWKEYTRRALWGAVVAGAILLFFAMVVYGPSILAEQLEPLTRAQRMTTVNQARSALVQMAGGLAVLGGFFYTVRTYKLSRLGQVTSRYESAIVQLGSENLAVRVGGIYALEQLGHEAPFVRQPIIDLLVSFVHTRSAELVTQQSGQRRWRSSRSVVVADDIEIAFGVLSRRWPKARIRQVDLDGVSLRKVRLRGISLDRATLSGAHLIGVSLVDASLQRASLRGVVLVDSDLSGAKLCHADLRDADMRGAILYETDFKGATLNGCDLRGCELSDANNLTPAQIESATT